MKPLYVDSKAMRLPEIFDFQQFPIAESWKFSEIKNCPKLSRPFSAFGFHENKPKIFPKLKFETPVQKYTEIFKNIPEFLKIPKIKV